MKRSGHPCLPPYAQARRTAGRKSGRRRRESRPCLKTELAARRGRKGLDTYCRLNAQMLYDLVLTGSEKAAVREEIGRWESARVKTVLTEEEAEEEAGLEHPDHLPARTCALCFGQLIAVTLRRGA